MRHVISQSGEAICVAASGLCGAGCYASSVDLSAVLGQDRRTVAVRSNDHAALGQAIRELRLTTGLSQEAFADRCGLHRTYVGGIERGERNLSFANLLRVAHALGVRPSELLVRYERCLLTK
jgi:DNA-binding XRE family transcriptional regulator